MSLQVANKLSSHFRFFTTVSPVSKFLHLQYNYISSSAINSITHSCNQESFKVSYLINSCGLSPKHALLASKHLNLKTPENADYVLAFFKKHGFTNTQISNIVRKFPQVLSSDCENTILPKLEYFTSVGFSSAILAKFVAATPRLLQSSLVNTIIPTWTFFKSVVLTNERTNIAIRRYLAFGWISNVEDCVIPNIRTLREFGVDESAIVSLLNDSPAVLKAANDRFKMTVEKVKRMGLNPQQVKFVSAVKALLCMSKSTWDKKVDCLKKWGWSEDDVYVAFSKNPRFMIVAENKMSSIMDMVVNKSGFDPSDVVQRPGSFTYSLEKRVVPRCLFYQVLVKRGLVTEKWKLSVLLGYSEARFMNAITKLYEEAAPELLKLYKEKLDRVTDGGLEV
ncbi:Transcription termination factor like [Heracleum sosnowskyi]|uniref:Transcription termination factor like n=1 Tax=Heracleum sosnowskyi TaxID=360622 RepID=A0AAD8MSY0_9APIA|nr:Transcription termination factor like [Heracleum sosnowskyi]